MYQNLAISFGYTTRVICRPWATERPGAPRRHKPA